MGFVLYNLARLPEFQRDLRAEIQRAGPPDEVDYEKMPLLNAVINVRFRPVPSLFTTRVVDFVTMTGSPALVPKPPDRGPGRNRRLRAAPQRAAHDDHRREDLGDRDPEWTKGVCFHWRLP
jgi:hypothetical protein